MQEVHDLVDFRARIGGSDAERRASRHLADRLEALGRQVRIEPIRVWPAFAGAHLVHTALGIVGSVVSVYLPLPGFLLVLAAAVSTFGDLTGGFFLARRLFGARASQNVVSPEDEGKPGLLVLTAAYDTGRGGMLFGERLRRWPATFFWALMVILICATARLFGLEPTWLTVLQFIPTVVLIASGPLLIDAALAEPREGANWNASGVATVLWLAERYGRRLENFDVVVLLSGAGHPLPLGAGAWLRRHRAELDHETTAVVCLAAAGHGTPHYATKEGLVFSARLHPALTAICADLASAKPFAGRSLTAAYAARNAGLPATRISALGARDFAPDTVDPDALARTREFMCELIERIDDEIGPRLPD